ncbi:MAG: hypothetical protein GX776_07560 [Oxalobacter sp.]|nr:hypothetical protein [Oxalobacter sp.]
MSLPCFIRKGLYQEQQAATCEEQAFGKNLHGAAKTSFVKKCVTDTPSESAAQSCEVKAAEKNLHGAAKTSFMKKCIETTSN